MRKFILKALVFIVIGIILLSIPNLLFERTNYYRSQNDTDKFTSVPKDLKVVNTGSSHGMRDLEYDNTRGFNFALSSQDFYYDYEILKQYKNNLSKNCTVIIPISYFSFGITYDQFKYENIDLRYYRFLNYRAIKFHNTKDLFRLKFFPLLSSKDNLKYLFKDNTPLKGDWESISKNQYDKDSIAAIGKKRADYHMEINSPKNYSYNLGLLENIIKFCKENHFKPVLITTPFTSYYNNSIPKSFYTQFYKMIDDECKKYNIKYIDYSRDERFSNNAELFADTDHLNSIGRKKFSSIILKELNIK